MFTNLISQVSLGSVAADATGTSVDTRFIERKSVFLSISSAAGSVGFLIQDSPDNSSWYDFYTTKYYTGSIVNDSVSWESHSPYTRVNSTGVSGTVVVSATVTGGGK